MISIKLLLPIPSEWNLNDIQLYEIYKLEKELSYKLRNEKDSLIRKELYKNVYSEYFERLPFHPQLTIKNDDNLKKQRILFQTLFILPFLKNDDIFIEIGAGDCSLSREVSKSCKEVIALEVSNEIALSKNHPDNLQLVIFDGYNFPLEDESTNVAFSNQLLEHLHPEDAYEQTKNVLSILKPKGKYICITPNRLTGPHDVSRFYSKNLMGFHLREYSSKDIRRFFYEVGFNKVRFINVVKKRVINIPFILILILESLISLVPKTIRKKILKFKPFSIIFHSVSVAIK